MSRMLKDIAEFRISEKVMLAGLVLVGIIILVICIYTKATGDYGNEFVITAMVIEIMLMITTSLCGFYSVLTENYVEKLRKE